MEMSKTFRLGDCFSIISIPVGLSRLFFNYAAVPIGYCSTARNIISDLSAMTISKDAIFSLVVRVGIGTEGSPYF